MQVLAGTVFVVVCAFLWGLAITDGPALLDYIRDTEGTPSWLTAKWVAMSDAASLHPWRWYGIGALILVASVATFLVLALRSESRRPPRGPF